VIAKGIGSTGVTFSGMMSYARASGVLVILFENVPELLRDQNWIPLMAAFKEVGFAVSGKILFSDSFKIPQKRARVFGVAVSAERNNISWEEAEILAEEMVTMALALVCNAPDAAN